MTITTIRRKLQKLQESYRKITFLSSSFFQRICVTCFHMSFWWDTVRQDISEGFLSVPWKRSKEIMKGRTVLEYSIGCFKKQCHGNWEDLGIFLDFILLFQFFWYLLLFLSILLVLLIFISLPDFLFILLVSVLLYLVFLSVFCIFFSPSFPSCPWLLVPILVL